MKRKQAPGNYAKAGFDIGTGVAAGSLGSVLIGPLAEGVDPNLRFIVVAILALAAMLFAWLGRRDEVGT